MKSQPLTDFERLLAAAGDPRPHQPIDAALERALEKRRREREAKERAGQLDEIRERCKSLKGFIQEAWPVLEPEQHLEWGWALDAMIEHLEAVSRGDILRLLVNVPPGMMKSLMTGVFLPAHRWGPEGRPALRILGTSYRATLAERDSGRMRSLVTSDWYQDLFPHVRLIGRGSDPSWENTATGWRKATPFASLTGDRGDMVVVDDPHSVEGGESEADRTRSIRRFRETLPTRLNSQARSTVIVIMQRVHETDVSGEIISKKLGYTHLMLPMEFDPARRCTTVIRRASPSRPALTFTDPRTYENELVFPEQFPREAVERLKVELTPYAAAGQLQQAPAPREGLMFKRSWFEVVKFMPMGGNEARAWDLAASEKKTQKADPDYTVGLKGKRLADGTFLITHMYRDRVSSGEVARAIKNYAVADGRACHVKLPQDPGAAGKALAAMHATMLAGYPFTIEPVNGDKITRAEPAAASAHHGQIKVLEADWNDDFFAEVCKFPASSHDDIVDALSDLIDTLSNVATYNLDNVMD